jgi:hypothetical protein
MKKYKEKKMTKIRDTIKETAQGTKWTLPPEKTLNPFKVGDIVTPVYSTYRASNLPENEILIVTEVNYTTIKVKNNRINWAFLAPENLKLVPCRKITDELKLQPNSFTMDGQHVWIVYQEKTIASLGMTGLILEYPDKYFTISNHTTQTYYFPSQYFDIYNRL